MRISNLDIKLTATDINELLEEFFPEVKIRITEIEEDGLHGQLKLLMWNVDFIAHPHADRDHEMVSLDVSAHKLVPIPTAIVERQLREAIKDAPYGIEVLREALKVHLPSILQPLGLSIRVREFKCYSGVLTLGVEQLNIPRIKELLDKKKRNL